jgi:hypothetical protein
MNKIVRFVGGALCLACSTGALAGVVQVNDPSMLAPGPFTLEEFEDPALEPGATYTTPTGAHPANPFIVSHAAGSGGVGPSGIQGLGASPGPLIITYDVPATSLGF